MIKPQKIVKNFTIWDREKIHKVLALTRGECY